jgi:hypothetical protein
MTLPATSSSSRTGISIDTGSVSATTTFGLRIDQPTIVTSQNYGVSIINSSSSTGATNIGYSADISGVGSLNYGIQNLITCDVTGGGSNYGTYTQISSGAGANSNYGSYVVITSTNSATNTYGYYSESTVTAGTQSNFYGKKTGAATGTAYGMYIEMSNTATNHYGVYLKGVAGATNNYSIFTNDGTAVFNDLNSASSDFQINGQTDNNTFYVDASTDRVGIGTSTPISKLNVIGNTTVLGNLYVSGGTESIFSGNSTSDLVKIIQTGTGNAFVVEDSGGTDSSHFVIDASGNTSIGTSTTGRKLTVSGDSTFIHNPVTLLTSSVTGYGDIVTFGTGSTTAGNLYYLTSLGGWAQTDADSSTTSTGLLGIALGTTATTAGVLIKGYARSTAYASATGAILYVSTTTGSITSTAPTGAGDIVRIIGYQIDATNDVIYFNPSNDWIQL